MTKDLQLILELYITFEQDHLRKSSRDPSGRSELKLKAHFKFAVGNNSTEQVNF